MINNWEATKYNKAKLPTLPTPPHSSTPPPSLIFFQVPTRMHPTKKTIFILAMALTMATHVAGEELDMEEETRGKLDVYLTSLRGASSFLPEGKITCKRDPTVCYVSGSPGPYCCNKVCVDIYSNHRNCGGCKNKCKNSQMCCSGNCVPAHKGCGSSAA